ncbi:MAG: ATP-binding cassette domain-containing protein [Holophagaceae bacterium]|nr:ATP-binding cassette domain-containing protein [Holophagaceae bacterium]
MEYAVCSDGMTKKYGNRTVVDNLGLRVHPGHITGFLGPNGAGKTTTISLLLGLLRLDSGICEVLGYPPGDHRGLKQIGALVESPSLYDHLTGIENLEITRLMRGVPKSDLGRVLSIVGLTQDAKRPVRTYSLGMKQRLGMALALMGEPRLLILDEPLNGLDPAGILEMRELIRELPKKDGITVFLSSHILAEVEQIATDLVIIHHGKLRYQGSIDGLVAHEDSEVAFRVNDPKMACELFSKSSITARVEPEIVIACIPHIEIPMANSMLVHNGISVYEITPSQKNLESRFLALLEDA